MKPKCMASTTARTALTTDAQPLIAQAQGMKSAAAPRSERKPRGKGMPIATARGATSTTETTPRQTSPIPAKVASIAGSRPA